MQRAPIDPVGPNISIACSIPSAKATGATVVVAFVVLLLNALCCSAAAAQPPPLIEGPGVWTLARLGYEDQVLEPRDSIATASVAYRLPADARQGGEFWYRVRLHFTVELARASGSGRIYVSAGTGAATDVRTSAQIIVKVRRTTRGLTFVVDTLDLTRGHRVRRVEGRFASVRFENFVPYGGVVPGDNVLAFRVEEYGNARARRVHFFDDSGIVVSALSPARTAVAVTARPRLSFVGDVVTVSARVANSGGLTAPRGTVTLIAPARAFSVIGRRVRSTPAVPGGSQVTTRFRLRTRIPGRFRVRVVARNALESELGYATVRVRARPTALAGRARTLR